MKQYKIYFEYKNDLEKEHEIESAWAEKIGEHYKLDNILFYAKEYSLGDIVSVKNINNELIVQSLIKESGHSTVRVFFHQPEIIQKTLEDLQTLGCSFEISNIKELVAIDIPRELDYALIKNYLDLGEKLDNWAYEEACIAHSF